MSRFSIWIVQPKGWPHMRMFVESASAVAHSLRHLGHDVAFAPGDGVLVENPRPWGRDVGRPIIFGAHFLPDVPLPADTIIYNFEQVPGSVVHEPQTPESAVPDEWLRADVLKILRRHTVWDYSLTNIERLRRLGVEDVHHCPIGYSPALEKIVPAAEEDVDVLFYGSLMSGSRRMKILDDLEDVRVSDGAGGDRPLKICALSGVYGAERDSRIARAKVVLNVHANNPEIAPAIWEIVRCSYLLANKKCVVSEGGGQDPDLERFAASATAYVPYDGVVPACVSLIDEAVGGMVRDEPMTASEARQALAEAGYAALRRVDQTEAVKKALEECP